jgi:hypothetical protein
MGIGMIGPADGAEAIETVLRAGALQTFYFKLTDEAMRRMGVNPGVKLRQVGGGERVAANLKEKLRRRLMEGAKS